jgi:hypothetical protein
MRRIVMLVVVALVMAAMMLVMVAPAMAQGRPEFSDCPRGERPAQIEPGTHDFRCVPIGPPGG